MNSLLMLIIAFAVILGSALRGLIAALEPHSPTMSADLALRTQADRLRRLAASLILPSIPRPQFAAERHEARLGSRHVVGPPAAPIRRIAPLCP